MNELALFAGAGGGLLASRLLGWRTVCAVEINDYCRRVLAARQRDGVLDPFEVWDDVRTFDGNAWRGRVDVVSGGFPCQAFSSAARGRNNAADLWPEMRRIVGEVAPQYVFAENVVRRAIDAAADELEAMGYQTRAVSLSAADLGADHIRQRYWLLGYTDRNRESRRAEHDEVAGNPSLSTGVWQAAPEQSGMDDGMAARMERLAAVGNGQVPLVAATAWRILMKDHP